ncbi:MAG: hypothetical protein ABSB76_20160 [Streptosporangiaceae bacterium]
MSAPTTLDLLWGTAQRPKRGPKPSLTLERIVAEAIEHADADGLVSLSMQRLAEGLGCAKMANRPLPRPATRSRGARSCAPGR